MSLSSALSIKLIFPQDGEAWSALTRRVKNTEGDVLLILSGKEHELIAQPEVRAQFLKECAALKNIRIATKHPAIAAEARGLNIRVLDRTKHLRALLHGQAQLNDALRVFSPQLWRQQLKSRLQHIGFLSVPKLRIFSLAGLSGILFFIVIFRLLPSAEIFVKPRQESVSQTINIFLVQSGASVEISDRVRRMALMPLTIQTKKSLQFDHISQEFIGISSQVDLTIINKSSEQYTLRTGTRFSNQAGMIFKILSYAIIEPGKEVTVRAKAEDTDLYDQIIGARGNVPAGLKWELPGLPESERALVYAENRTPAKGGTTAYRTVLRQQDLDLARKKLEQDLLTQAKEELRQRVTQYNLENPTKFLQTLDAPIYGKLIQTVYYDFVMPTDQLGKEIKSIPIQGSISYIVLGYDSKSVFQELLIELQQHVREGRILMEKNIGYEQLVANVIDYANDLSWVKLTVDLTGTEEYILEPLSPTGALFGKKIRSEIVGKKREDALRIIRNMPEVESAEVKQWPPWNTTLPRIGSHISIITE